MQNILRVGASDWVYYWLCDPVWQCHYWEYIVVTNIRFIFLHNNSNSYIIKWGEGSKQFIITIDNHYGPFRLTL